MQQFWKNKNVLITGVTGFIGGNLTKKIVEHGANVFGLVRNSNPKSFLFYEKIDKQIRILSGGLDDVEVLYSIITEERIDVIFHLAAQVEVGVGLTNPYLTFETNVRGTYNLMEACRRAKNSGHEIQSIIVASSDKAYGEYSIEQMPYRETYPLLPKYPYDTSKACADLICQAYAIDQYKLPVVITRFSNIYGPGQMNFSAIIPDAIRSALGYSNFIPRSDGSMVRDFIFVEDVASLYMKISEHLSQTPDELRGEIFNAGTDSPISMKEVIVKVFDLIGNQTEKERILRDMAGKKTTGEINYQHMAFDKVYSYFQWSPVNEMDEGLKKTIEWFKMYFNNNKEIN